MTVRMISSPFSRNEPKLEATRLIASVVPRVKTISWVEAALMYARTRSRVASIIDVDSWDMENTPRWTLALC